MTLLVSLVAVVAAAGVTGLRKDVQKNMCYAGAGVSGDDFVNGSDNSGHFNQNAETCRLHKDFDGDGDTEWMSMGTYVFRGKTFFSNVPY